MEYPRLGNAGFVVPAPSFGIGTFGVRNLLPV